MTPQHARILTHYRTHRTDWRKLGFWLLLFTCGQLLGVAILIGAYHFACWWLGLS